MDSFDYYDFRLKMVTEKINKEIDFYNKCEYASAPIIANYLTYLNGRFYNGKFFPDNMTHYDKNGNKYEIEKMDWSKYDKDIDIFNFKKQWNKIKPFHKIMKINQFINDLNYGKKATEKDIIKNRKSIIKKLVDGLSTKKFCKNKNEIIYDPEKMTITSISCLHYNKRTGLYKVIYD